ncbi:hypothetical protein OR571_13370 [Psychrobacillus sp. NEAU-3TGS]|uniref:hypothetical protein n=1 Tax=Psychrobacillus sp. NEAU-3TGS TaxID=2995412 RepID=UPI00249900A8|nr:hypothetical protein [Psychrobacillus sp. NEAU-3TGS]MDI2588078.1 hypothetical protein [Psychrobacillus sp. NEAU-3TGS]
MKTPVAVCESDRCEKVIKKGEEMWHKGSELYCSGKCLFDSFGHVKQTILREKQVVGGTR